MNKETNEMEKELKQINVLIDKQEINEIEAALDNFMKKNEFPYKVEESKVFAKRIINSQKGGAYSMRKSIAVASIIGICLIGATAAYASGILQRFTFHTSKGIADVVSTEGLTQEQAEQKVDDLIKLPEPSGQTAEILEPSERRYRTIEEAEEQLDFQLVLPSNGLEIFGQEKEVMVLFQPELEKTFVYIIFNQEDEEKGYSSLSININKETYHEGTSISMRPIPDELYITRDDIKYEITREKDEVANTTCLKATTYIEEYEYSVFSNGMEEATFYDMIESIDVSVYKNMKDK